MTTGEAQNFAQNFALPVLTEKSMRALALMKRLQPQPQRIKCDRMKTTKASHSPIDDKTADI
jgi:hypothetical protein